MVVGLCQMLPWMDRLCGVMGFDLHCALVRPNKSCPTILSQACSQAQSLDLRPEARWTERSMPKRMADSGPTTVTLLDARVTAV